jgi:hypothetical protein
MTLQRSLPSLLAAFVLTVAVAASVGRVSTAREGACSAATVTRLYLGQNTPAGAVTETQWRAFVAEAVSPRFPDGFTELNGQGQWRDARGTINAERTRIIEIAHADAARPRADVRAIAADYRRRFAQESVLITRTRALQCFEDGVD